METTIMGYIGIIGYVLESAASFFTDLALCQVCLEFRIQGLGFGV